MPKGISRRDAIKKMGVMAGAAMIGPKLVGCGDDGGGSPDARGPGAITNIVVVMMENRSYDHYLGARKLLEQKGGDGLVATMSNLDMGGTPHAIYRETVDCVADPPHGWDASRAQFNAGLNDGFMKQYQDAHPGVDVLPHVMGYFARDELPVTWALADAYTSCDRWFSSVMGPTWPNRYYLHSGQSNGKMENLPLPTVAWPTLYDRLAAAGIPWNYYYTDLPFLFSLPGNDSSKWKAITDFYADARAGTLAPVVMADAGFGLNDDHPPHHPLLGQQFIASIYNALAASPQWNSTLLVVTYDEHGGFFDHVAPPKAADERMAQGFDQLGFRVPTMVIGPYVKQGYVSSVVYDHTSVLKQIENMFQLAPLTMRDAAANDLSDMIDQTRLAAGDASAPVTLPVVNVDPATLDPVCFDQGSPKPTDIELAFDQGLFPPEFDRRRHNRDTLHFIAEYLAKHDLGGVRR